MKRFIVMLLCAVLFSSAGCKSQQELPSGVAEVGGAIVKEDDLLEPASSSEQNSTLPGNFVSETITAEMVMEWYREAVEGDFSQFQEDEMGISVAEATMPTGGTIEVMNYYGVYYSTTFAYDMTGVEDGLVKQVAEHISIYLARSLTDMEYLELKTAIEAVRLGSERVFLQTLSEFVQATIYLENGHICVQCS